MNDFTKEELQIINQSLLYFIGMTENYKNESVSIRDKTQTMIDNYREHDVKWIATAHLKEASSLISHAMELLTMGLSGLEDDNK